MQRVLSLLDLTGKVAIVTGAGMGIGRGIAIRLAEAGAAIVVSDIDLEAARQTVSQIEAQGGRAQAVQADVRNASDAEKVTQEAIKVFGSLDILVNNAGIFPSSPVLDMSEEQWDQVLDINLKGVFLFSRAACRAMVAAGRGGRIINICSISSVRPTCFVAHYNASKAGVALLTKSLALELGGHQITANAVAPGWIITPGSHLGDADMPEGFADLPKKILAGVPLGRLGEPEDVANVVLFLAGSASAYVTGTVIPVDGGHLLSW